MKTVPISTAIALCIFLVAVRAQGEAEQPGKSTPWPNQLSGEKLFGKAGDPKKVSSTVYVDMSDKMYFNPAKLTIQRGETVRFVVKNSGKDFHQMVIGTIQDLEEHGQLMASFPGMVEHAGAYMTYVAPGKTEEIVWQFTEDGEFNFGCVIPRHAKAAEVGKIFVVSPASSVK